jgi:hypothetical protein
MGTLLVLAWLLLAVALPAGLIWFRAPAPADARDATTAAQPGDPVGVAADKALAEYRARMQEWLGGYGWVDREAGIARVPIEQGMQAVLRAGLPARDRIEEDR